MGWQAGQEAGAEAAGHGGEDAAQGPGWVPTLPLT